MPPGTKLIKNVVKKCIDLLIYIVIFHHSWLQTQPAVYMYIVTDVVNPFTTHQYFPGPWLICLPLFPRSPCCGSYRWRPVWSWLWRTSWGRGRTACHGPSPHSTCCLSFRWPTLWWAWPTPPSSESTWRKHQSGNKHTIATTTLKVPTKAETCIWFKHRHVPEWDR